jgi:outer membrane lipoprotein-sorting protein
VVGRVLEAVGESPVSHPLSLWERIRVAALKPRSLSVWGRGKVKALGDGTSPSPDKIERIRKMKRIAKIAVAATAVVGMGIIVSWVVIGGGSTSLALAEVAKALDSLRSATYEETVEVKNPIDGKRNTFRSKSMFLAPSRQRSEISMPMGPGGKMGNSIMIMDLQAMKALSLLPEQKQAVKADLSKIKRSRSDPSNMFEMVRQLVREGNGGGGGKAESLGKKEIDGRMAVGFRTRSNMADMTIWADPETARPIRIELYMPSYDSHGVMSNFCYDVALDPTLFSLEPPAGYTVISNMQAAMPVEQDLIDVLRLIAKHNNGVFPSVIGMSKEYMEALQAESKEEADKLLEMPEAQELMKKLKAKYGKDQSGYMKEWMQEWMKMSGSLVQKHTLKAQQGPMFYMMLKPENDSHYAGKGVKLGTPDRPIFWYKPTGAEKYRVIYADLSIKELAADEVKKLPGAKPK